MRQWLDTVVMASSSSLISSFNFSVCFLILLLFSRSCMLLVFLNFFTRHVIELSGILVLNYNPLTNVTKRWYSFVACGNDKTTVYIDTFWKVDEQVRSAVHTMWFKHDSGAVSVHITVRAWFGTSDHVWNF